MNTAGTTADRQAFPGILRAAVPHVATVIVPTRHVFRVTYSSLLPADSPQNGSIPSELASHFLFSRLSYLLHCPTEVEGFWPRVLDCLGKSLRCSAAALYLPPAIATQVHHYRWGQATAPSTPEAIADLWQFLGMTPQPGGNALWQCQITDLRAQLTTLAFRSNFRCEGAQSFQGKHWPRPLHPLFSGEHDQHLLLLPLRAEASRPQDGTQNAASAAQSATLTTTSLALQEAAPAPHPFGLGLLALLRDPLNTPWSAEEVETAEYLAGQIYLALQRSLLDQVALSRSTRDQLTQLPDRALFNQQLTLSLAQSAAKDMMLGVAFLDLDRFKNINDTLGHAAGDCLIKQVSERLKSCLRSYDLVARWGGDEFTLLFSGLKSAEDITSIAERILERLAAPFYVQEQELYVTASLGIALAPYDGEDEQTLLRNADAAMYQAKARGRNNYQIYFEEINADARTQLNLETDLRKALDGNELFLCYQPQIDLHTGQWIGLEALVRWQHPSLGLISPGKFIPIAEETGLIEPIGHWVLQAACQQYHQWKQQGFPPLRLAVNLSAQQFHRSNLVRSVMAIVADTDFDPHYLELEVTESAAMQDVQFAIDVLKKLSHVGIQIAMDDFGTGYSSLSVLKHFPLDTLKIDRSFVMDLVDNPSDAAIASTIIALAKGLNFKVLAEGIETEAQIHALTNMGCDYAQGYWYSRPLTVGRINELLNSGIFYQIAKLGQ